MKTNFINCKRAFTLAETLITMALVAIVMVLGIYSLDIGKSRQKAFLQSFVNANNNFQNIATRMIMTNDQQVNWHFTTGTFANLTCTEETANDTECFKKALISTSSQIRECTNKYECISSYDNFVSEIQSQYHEFGRNNNIFTFQIIGGATGVLSYMDSDCSLALNVKVDGENKVMNGVCGVIALDVNGDNAPNKLYENKNSTADRYLLYITKNGIEEPTGLDSLICDASEEYSDGKCVEKQICRYDMTEMKAIESANSSKPDNIRIVNKINDNCYAVQCTTGIPNPETKKCATPCSKEDEQRLGGLYPSEGGDYPANTEKACCIPISTAKEFTEISRATSRNYCLLNDLTLPTNWKSISGFSGSLYGNGHKIMQPQNSEPIFSGTVSGLIENLILQGSTTLSNNQTGGFAQTNTGTIRNILTSLSVQGSKSQGSSFVYYNNGTIKNIINKSSIGTNIENAVGFVSQNQSSGKIEKILNQNSIINGTNAYGLITDNSGTISSIINQPNFINSTKQYGLLNTNINGSISKIINSPTFSNISTQYGLSYSNKANIFQIFNTPNFSGIGTSYGLTAQNYSKIEHILNMPNSPILNNNSSSGSLENAVMLNNVVAIEYNNGEYSNIYYQKDKMPSKCIIYNVEIAGGCLSLETTPSLSSSIWQTSASYPPSLQANNMPPQISRDCQSNSAHILGCYDVLNTRNSFDFKNVWAWRIIGGSITTKNSKTYRSGNAKIDLAFRWQCSPYKTIGGYTDCCRPNYIESGDNRLPVCPELE